LHRAGQVVTIELVEEIIGIMGRPSDYGEEGETETKTEAEPQKEPSPNYSHTSKRLYRNPDQAVVGGVLSGLSIYLGMDVVWLRIIFAVLVILGVGTIIPIYLVLWLVIPKAETTAQRMEMQGIDVTIENIKAEANKVKERFQSYVNSGDIDKKKEQIKSEAYRVKNNFSNYVNSNEFHRGVNEVGTTAGNVIKGIFKAIFAIIGGVIGLAGAIVVVALLIALIISMVEPSWLVLNFPNNAISTYIWSNGNIGLMIGALLILIGVPVFMLFYIAIKMLSGDTHLSSTAKWVSLLLWLAGLFFLISISTKFAYFEWWNQLF
jgi:phage shock protein PspC (stress-responsive transcriptional regulator)